MILQEGYQFFVVGTVGTTTITTNPANLIGAFVPGTYVGTVIFQDASTTMGTIPIGTLGIPNTSVAGFIPIPARCKYGLIVQATGTPTMTIFWDGL